MQLAKASGWSIVALVVGGGLALYLLPFSGATRPVAAAAPATPVAATSIACLGRIEPGDGVVRLAARSLSGQPAIVGTLLVAERDQVKAGQVLVELDSVPQLRATTLLFEAHVEAARKRLEQVKAGAKGSDIAAQRAEIERVDTELENAQKDLRRYQGLRETKSVSDSALDAVRLKVDTLAKVRQQAAQRLTSLSEVRPVDVDVAKAELEASIREVALARTQYDAALIRAPLDGRVVKVHAWPGEQVGPAGVIEIAKTDRMYVLAEIAEGDMARVKAGQRATVTGHGLPGSLTGTVESVGMQVTQNSVLKVDPAEFSDARVVEAKIRLDGGERVAQLIHLRVNVLIESGPSSSGRRDGQ